MEKSSSPLDTLRQLRELLDAGTITPQEFETLKSRLLATPTVPLNPTFTTETPPVALPAPPTPDPTQPLASPVAAATETPAAVPGYEVPPAGPVGEELLPEARLEPEETEEPPRSPLGKILAIGGGLLLLALVLYLVLGQSRPSEHLTSTSQTAADTVATTPETGPQAEQLDLPPVAAPETVRVAPAVPLTPDTAASAPGVTPDPAAATSIEPALPAESADEAANRVRTLLAAYYSDLQAAPFSAQQYFAPQVELFVILRNTTPAAINSWLDQNRFPEFKETQIQIEPGSLKVGPAATDGSRVITYVEDGRAFRQSLQKNQHVRAQMRVRINSDYKITYQKQERLLENTLSDAETPAPPQE